MIQVVAELVAGACLALLITTDQLMISVDHESPARAAVHARSFWRGDTNECHNEGSETEVTGTSELNA